MDPVSELVASAKIPVGRWGKAFFDFLTDNFAWFFDSIADGLTVVLDGHGRRCCCGSRRSSWSL